MDCFCHINKFSLRTQLYLIPQPINICTRNFHKGGKVFDRVYNNLCSLLQSVDLDKNGDINCNEIASSSIDPEIKEALEVNCSSIDTGTPIEILARRVLKKVGKNNQLRLFGSFDEKLRVFRKNAEVTLSHDVTPILEHEYQLAIRVDPSMSGKLTIEIVIDSEGRARKDEMIIKAEKWTGSGRDEMIEKIKNIIASTRFPRMVGLADNEVVIKYPVTFGNYNGSATSKLASVVRGLLPVPVGDVDENYYLLTVNIGDDGKVRPENLTIGSSGSGNKFDPTVLERIKAAVSMIDFGPPPKDGHTVSILIKVG